MNAPVRLVDQIDGRRAPWLARHGLRRASRDYCPCLLGTKRQVCDECSKISRRYRSYPYCWVEGKCTCGFPGGWGFVDHYRTWTRKGERVVFTTEPYGMHRAEPELLREWSARKGVAVFEHPSAEGFHNPGNCLFFALVAGSYSDEYARLEPTAVRL